MPQPRLDAISISMKPLLLACGSNGSGQLALHHTEDVHTLQPCAFHPSLEALIRDAKVIDLVSASTHSLLLLKTPGGDPRCTNILLGAGTNSLGQLGPRCALWGGVKPETKFKPVDLLGPLDLSRDDWEPVRIASTWTTSFVVYQKVSQGVVGGSSSAAVSAEEQNVEQMVLASGSNDFGELGLPRATEHGVPISRPSAKPSIEDLGLRDGEWVEMIKGGQRHVIAVICSGSGEGRKQRVVGWGAARRGELDVSILAGEGPVQAGKGKGKGKGKSTARLSTLAPTELDLPIPTGAYITDVAVGASHTLVLLSNGDVFAWGSDAKGQITGLGELGGVRGITATWNGSYLLKDEALWSQGSDNRSQLLRRTHGNPTLGQVEIPDRWTAEKIVAGSEDVIVVASKEGEQDLWVGGWNEHGNLGLGDQLDRGELTRININHVATAAGLTGQVQIRGIWAGCAATWVCLDSSPS